MRAGFEKKGRLWGPSGGIDTAIVRPAPKSQPKSLDWGGRAREFRERLLGFGPRRRHRESGVGGAVGMIWLLGCPGRSGFAVGFTRPVLCQGMIWAPMRLSRQWGRRSTSAVSPRAAARSRPWPRCSLAPRHGRIPSQRPRRQGRASGLDSARHGSISSLAWAHGRGRGTPPIPGPVLVRETRRRAHSSAG